MENAEYLINELKSGRNIKVLFISHNAYWSKLTKFEHYYKNWKVDIAGETGFFGWNRTINDYDIIYDNSSYKFSKEDLNKLEEIAAIISKKENKRVSILYSYISEKDNGITNEMRIVSLKDSIKHEETIPFNRYYTSILELTGLLLKTADELDNQKIKTKQDCN